MPVELLRPRIPAELEIDTFEGQAWVGVVPFEMQAVRFRFLPPLPTAHRFPELNLRTYVRHRGRSGETPGVWFFSLDASSALTVLGARATFSLPYMHARMAMNEPLTAGSWIQYRSERTHRGEPPARFEGRYRPSGPAVTSQRGTLEHFLTERYALFAQAGYGVPRKLLGGALRSPLLRGDIQHAHWPLQPAEAEIERCDIFRLIGLDEPPAGEPLAHYAESIPVRAFRPVPAGDARRAP
ncbi:hypothetical protein Poly30_49240 [Planctomycetes bacterium Poly30]|uniref:DUF2071 domain-containing protein n=2 Tax=Saltatorellus ferox TaxID=2528018 RepID=A0A518EZ59_9BACT|nr:hypothetical protein Poly30_49240 [Planctomycetes bacterium Poly30]